MDSKVVPAVHTPTNWERFKGRFLQGAERIAADADAGASPIVLIPFIGGNPVVRWVVPMIGRLAMGLLCVFLVVAVAVLALAFVFGK